MAMLPPLLLATLLIVMSLSFIGDNICCVGMDADIGPPRLPAVIMLDAPPPVLAPNEFSEPVPLLMVAFLLGIGCAALTETIFVGALNGIWPREAPTVAATVDVGAVAAGTVEEGPLAAAANMEISVVEVVCCGTVFDAAVVVVVVAVVDDEGPPMGVPMTAETVVWDVRFLRWEATPRLRWMWRRRWGLSQRKYSCWKQ